MMSTTRQAGSSGAGKDFPPALTMLEGLEPRVLLAGDVFSTAGFGAKAAANEFIEWHGARIEVREDSWVVGFHDQQSAAGAMAQATLLAETLGVRLDSLRPVARGHYASFTTQDRLSERDIAEALQFHPAVKSVEPNLVYHTDLFPNDPFFNQQWPHLNTGQFIPNIGQGTPGADISTPDAWDTTIGSQQVVVAVIDTGVDINHEDLRANIWRNPGEVPGNGVDDDGNGFIDDVTGWDFGDGDNDPTDIAGHGTAVAGVIGAVGNNGIGVAGVAWTVSILPIKVFPDFEGGASLEDIVAGHDYLTSLITDFGVNIVASNNSYGAFLPERFRDFFQGEFDAIQRFTDTGATFVAAAGNDGNDNDSVFTTFPASHQNPEIISVAATDFNDNLAGFSNFGLTNVDLAAPGVNTYTTLPGNRYGFISGTSFSSPYTAGAVAILKSFKPNASQEEIKRALLEGADPLPALQGRTVSGGRLNVDRSLEIIGVEGPIVRSITPGPVTAPVNQITATFSKGIDPTLVAAAGVTLTPSPESIDDSDLRVRYTGADRAFGTGDDALFNVGTDLLNLAGPDSQVGTGDDVIARIESMDRQIRLPGADNTLDTGDDVLVALDDASVGLFLGQSRLEVQFAANLPLGSYSLRLDDAAFRDNEQNRLNGNENVGQDEVYAFQVVEASGPFEPNDSLVQAPARIFSASGRAVFSNASIGDGVNGPLDVDLYRIDLAGPGLISARVDARNLAAPSDLDSYLRVFNARGEEIARNDNFNGLDSFSQVFVPNGGSYYIGVSGYPNLSYDPEVVASGVGQSTGLYTLVVDVDLSQPESIRFSGGGGAIPDGGSIVSTIDITDIREIQDLNVTLNVTHGFVSDLRVELTSPGGATMTLVQNRGGAGDNFTNTVLDDEAAAAIAAGSAPFSGSFRPETPLNTVDGRSAAGMWTLRVTDTRPGDAGTLDGWGLDLTLASTLFGPFEPNDALAIATETGINQSGTATFEAVIGDGAFGARDVDLYRLVAAAGTTISAVVSAESGTTDTVLRLFDAQGNPIDLDDRAATQDSSLSLTVPAGGTFYFGVSGAANTGYDPARGGSGAPTTGTGDYRITLSVVGGISDGGLVLEGNRLSLGISGDGVIGLTGSDGRVGIALDDSDFLVPTFGQSVPESFFGVSLDGNIFTNRAGATQADLPLSITDESDFANRRIVITGVFRGIEVRRTISFGVNDTFAAVDIALTNLGSSTVRSISVMEGFNPDPGLARRSDDARTINDVDNNLVTATYFDNDFRGGLAVGLAVPAGESRAALSVELPGTVRDPSQILDTPADPNGGTPSDSVIALALNMGDLSPGSTTSARYFVMTGAALADVQGLRDALDSGAAGGHLVAEPADTGLDAETLPFALYYPEGFANDRSRTFIPIVNPNTEAARVVVIARYETGDRDEVVFDEVIDGRTRSGVTLTTPETFGTDGQLVRGLTPYAIEVRSSSPVAATLSHFDFGIATGESFTSTTSTVWTFGEGFKGDGVNDFVIFYNTSDTTIKVTTTFYPEGGGTPVVLSQEIGAKRRGGWNVAAESAIPAGPYGVKVEAQQPIVAAMTRFDTNIGGGSGILGLPALGSTTGATPEGRAGVDAEQEFVTILNATSQSANITFTFLFTNGSSYRTTVAVPAEQRGGFSVGDLPAFPSGGQGFSVFYESSQPVSVTFSSFAFGEAGAAPLAAEARTIWGFAEGFRPLTGDTVRDYMRVYNANPSDTQLEITLSFNDGSSESFVRTVSARSVTEFNLFDFVTGYRAETGTSPGVGSFFGVRVKASAPIVTYFGHFDDFLGGGFGSLGTPLGISVPVA